MFKSYETRAEILGELHARPFELIATPQRIYHFGFLTNEQEAASARKDLQELCISRALPPPAPGAKYHRINLSQWTLRWEQHSEFTTYTWMTDRNAEKVFYKDDLTDIIDNALLKQPGPLIVATHIALTAQKISDELIADMFVPTSLCMFETSDKDALVIGDFYPDAQNLTKFIIEDINLDGTRAGALIQRLLEVETYRTLALIGLNAVKQAAPIISHAEQELVDLTQSISEENNIDTERALLKKMTLLAAKLEATSAQTSWRFSASDAYYSIVQARLSVIREVEVPGKGRTFSAFFARRLDPAMRTCRSMNERQQQLSNKLARTAELLRTRIQFELEEQNRNLLASMNRRARQQLRLQQTVEGLSVAAISYYVVGLISYVAKGFKVSGLEIAETLITAISVPVVILGVWYVVRKIRRNFESDKDQI